jgi:hypothetical protein
MSPYGSSGTCRRRRTTRHVPSTSSSISATNSVVGIMPAYKARTFVTVERACDAVGVRSEGCHRRCRMERSTRTTVHNVTTPFVVEMSGMRSAAFSPGHSATRTGRMLGVARNEAAACTCPQYTRRPRMPAYHLPTRDYTYPKGRHLFPSRLFGLAYDLIACCVLQGFVS